MRWFGRRDGAGRQEDSHRVLPKGLRRGACGHSPRPSGSSGKGQAARARQSPHLHRRSDRNHAGDTRRARLHERKAIAALRKQEPPVEVEIRWCLAHKGIPGNEMAAGWGKQAASEPDDHGVKWLSHHKGGRRSLPATSIAHLKRRASEKECRKPACGVSGDSSTRATSSGKRQA